VKVVALATDSAGSAAPLCGVNVPFSPRDGTMALSQRTASALQACRRVGRDNLSAIVHEVEGGGEDPVTLPPFVALRDSTVSTTRLWFGIEVKPGQALGLRLQLEALSGSGAGELVSLQVTFSTAVGGARGGTVRFAERSPLGRCEVVVPIPRGASAIDVAQAVARAASQVAGRGTLACDARHNPRDAVAEGANVITILARGVTVETTDPGIGLAIGPVGFPLSAVKAIN
jgi:hypothetical protein